MNEENFESEFKEKFATIEEALKYTADMQAKSEWRLKKFQKENEKFAIESQKRMAQIERHLAHITKLTGIALEDVMFQEEKLQNAGEILKEKRS